MPDVWGKCSLEFGVNISACSVVHLLDTTSLNHLKNKSRYSNDHRELYFRKCQAGLKSSVITKEERVGCLSSSLLLGKISTKFIDNLLLFTIGSCLLFSHFQYFASHLHLPQLKNFCISVFVLFVW